MSPCSTRGCPFQAPCPDHHRVTSSHYRNGGPPHYPDAEPIDVRTPVYPDHNLARLMRNTGTHRHPRSRGRA